ncbi:MAG: hypothetical protein VB141_11460 [Burkholderia gladioli]
MLSFSSGDLLKLLEQLPVWKQVVGMSKEIEALRKRVELLEQSQRQVPQADQCPKCNGLAFKIGKTIPHPVTSSFNPIELVYTTIKPSYGTEKYPAPSLQLEVRLQHTQTQGTESIALSVLLPTGERSWTELQLEAVRRAIDLLQAALPPDQQPSSAS